MTIDIHYVIKIIPRVGWLPRPPSQLTPHPPSQLTPPPTQLMIPIITHLCG